MRNSDARTLVIVSLAVAGAIGCGSDLRLPSASGEGVALAIVGGNGQTGTVGQVLPDPLEVSVAADGVPIPGHMVAFVVTGDAAAGRLEPDTAVTGSDGRATARWVLGSEAGAYEVQARLVVTEPAPPPSAVFEASALAGEPDTLKAASAVSQPGRIAQAVSDAPTVRVVDRFGNAVPSAVVSWDVTAGGGTASSRETATGADGKTTVTWTLGLGIGVQKLTARVEGAHGSPVTFTATVLF